MPFGRYISGNSTTEWHFRYTVPAKSSTERGFRHTLSAFGGYVSAKSTTECRFSYTISANSSTERHFRHTERHSVGISPRSVGMFPCSVGISPQTGILNATLDILFAGLVILNGVLGILFLSFPASSCLATYSLLPFQRYISICTDVLIIVSMLLTYDKKTSIMTVVTFLDWR